MVWDNDNIVEYVSDRRNGDNMKQNYYSLNNNTNIEFLMLEMNGWDNYLNENFILCTEWCGKRNKNLFHYCDREISKDPANLPYPRQSVGIDKDGMVKQITYYHWGANSKEDFWGKMYIEYIL